MAFTQDREWLLREKHSGRVTPAFARDLKRLKKGEHVDYVIGFAHFLGCKIDLSKKPFIPRPETEFWVERVIQELRKRVSKIVSPYSSPPAGGSSPRPNPTIFRNAFSPPSSSRPFTLSFISPLQSLRCLDMFAGSGCIGIAVLKHIPFARVDFAEKEKKFCAQIKINAKLNGIDSKRYRIIQSDVFSNVKGAYDYIFANPPYIAKSKKRKVQKSVLEQEPHGALFGGKDGLRHIRQFLKDAKRHLNPNGKVYMEFDSWQKPAIAKILQSENFGRIEFFRDQYGKWRYAVMQ